MPMHRIPRLLASILVAAVVLTAGAVVFAATDSVTTGQFLVAVAKAQHLDASDPAVAAGSLRAAGYALPEARLDSTLTEGTVAAIATSLGLRVTTQNPRAAFTSSQVDAFLSSFGPELGNRQGASVTTNSTDPSTRGKGKKKGLTKSRTEPL